MSDELVEAVARAMAERNRDLEDGVLQWQAWQDDARAAIAVVIERCEDAVNGLAYGDAVAAIRKLGESE